MLNPELLRDDQPFVLRQRRPDLTSDEAFLRFQRDHPDVRIESDAEGTLIIMSPTGWQSSNRNARITTQLTVWAEQDGTGEVSDSSGLYRLPGGARRAPDAAWTSSDRLAQVPRDEREGILPLMPDFVVELRSPSDRMPDLMAKMEEYMQSGVRLAWLIDPVALRTYEFRPGQPVRTSVGAVELRGDPELKGFLLDLTRIW